MEFKKYDHLKEEKIISDYWIDHNCFKPKKTKLNKNQPFVTNVPINFVNTEECKAIKNLKIHVKNCIEINQNKDQCKNLVKIKENLSGDHLISTNIIKDSSFFNSDNNKLYLKEFMV